MRSTPRRWRRDPPARRWPALSWPGRGSRRRARTATRQMMAREEGRTEAAPAVAAGVWTAAAAASRPAGKTRNAPTSLLVRVQYRTEHQPPGIIKSAGTQGFISLSKHPREPWRVVRNLAAPDAAVSVEQSAASARESRTNQLGMGVGGLMAPCFSKGAISITSSIHRITRAANACRIGGLSDRK